MGAGTSLNRSGLASLGVFEIAKVVAEFDDPDIAEYCQACIDFSIDGEMLTTLPRDQLVDSFFRAGVESEEHLCFLLEEVDKIRSPTLDARRVDRECLREFLGRTENLSTSDWDQTSESSAWSGVSMNSEDRVDGLDVTGRGLSGELPAALGKVSHLQYLHAGSNQLTGPIPEAIGNLVRLNSLRLDHNKLLGRLPASLARLVGLTALDLAWNQIIGTIPIRLSMMTALRQLTLCNNKLSGTLPKELGSLHLLEELRLRENQLAGKIPPLWSNMRSLTALDLTSNSLQGHIPESLGEMTALRELWLGDNQLVGPLPEALSKLTSVESLDLSSNRLSGKLTGRLFGSLSSLLYLNLSRNLFEGNMPLEALLPAYPSNELTTSPPRTPNPSDAASGHRGVAADAQGSRAPLSYLNLSYNQLTGSIPEGIGRLIALDILDLSHNKLEGRIPPDIRDCISLRVLSLSECCLSGYLRGSSEEGQGQGAGGDGGMEGRGPSLERLTKLESLRLDGNIFEGHVPLELGKLNRLEVLNLQGNCFSGYLPSTLGKLDQLWGLAVRDNQLSGKVPPSFKGMTNLRSLRLDGNPALQGPVPLALAAAPTCCIRADEGVLEDTEALMLGARLSEWFLMPREVFLNMAEFQGYASVRPSLVRYVSTVAPYECHVFTDAKGRRRVVRRIEIAFLSHLWELSPDQCPPKLGLLEGPFPDTADRAKLRHMKACIQDAPASVRYVWLDMLCVPLAEATRRRAAGRSLPFFVQNSSRYYILVSEKASLQRYKTRAWCRLEALCAACPYHADEIKSAFDPKPRDTSGGSDGFVYDAVECFASVWNRGHRIETLLGGGEGLAAAGMLGNPSTGKLSDRSDRHDIAEGTLRVLNAMELAGRLESALARQWRYACEKILYAAQQDCLSNDLEPESCYSGSIGSRSSSTGRKGGRRAKPSFFAKSRTDRRTQRKSLPGGNAETLALTNSCHL